MSVPDKGHSRKCGGYQIRYLSFYKVSADNVIVLGCATVVLRHSHFHQKSSLQICSSHELTIIQKLSLPIVCFLICIDRENVFSRADCGNGFVVAVIVW